MDLKTYIESPGALSVAELAGRIGVKSQNQLRQWQHGYSGRRPGPEYCVLIEQATQKAVTRQELRPDDWQRIWPELVAT